MKKNDDNIKKMMGILRLAITLTDTIKPLVLDVVNNNHSDKKEEMAKVPNIHHKDFPLDVDQAITMLESCGLRYSKSPLTIKNANPRYKDCLASQVILSNPKQGTVVPVGSMVTLKYVPEEVILESQRLFDEIQKNKIEAKEDTKKNISLAVKKVKQGVIKTKDGVEKVFKRNNKVESIEEDLLNGK